ncbi:MAG: hypothetical protein KatS3mg111_2948 [Pirellulaceae bacterium]|nr:MAG: hypothetical protein KatS3mg111_2948 [Pirellulaceae bacterium]
MDIDVASRCTVCRCYVDHEDLFCANCGAEHETTAPPPPSQMVVSFTCQSCGASMRYDAAARALRCPFCGSTRVQEQPPHREVVAERMVAPRIGRAKAEQILRAWLRKGFWRPSDAEAASRIAEMTGVFVPFWVFSVETSTRWTADVSPPPPGRHGTWRPVYGKFASRYEQVLVPASSVLTVAETEAIAPFELDESPVEPEPVPRGWVVESFKLSRKAVRPVARGVIEQLELAQAVAQCGGRRHRHVHVNVQLEGLVGRPALIPIWILVYHYRKRPHRVLINGQTGKIHGQAPFAVVKLAVLILVAVIVLVVLLAVGVLVSSR